MDKNQDSSADMIVVDVSSIPGVGYGAWATDTIHVNTVFGPLYVEQDKTIEGTVILAPQTSEEKPEYKPDIDKLLSISMTVEETSVLTTKIEQEHPESSVLSSQIKQEQPEYKTDIDNLPPGNWVGFLNCARNKDEENLVSFESCGSVFFRVTKMIPPKTELLVDDCLRNSCWKTHDAHHPTDDSGSETTQPKIHRKEIAHECEVCGKRFNRSGTLIRHVKIHTGEKPHTCDTCGKRFNVPGNLNVHMRIHREEKPFACGSCERLFRTSSDLKRHIKVHTAEKPHKCDICGKCFTQSGTLTSHVRVHTGEKPFACNICSHSCTTSSLLNKHVRTHGRKVRQL